MGRTIGVDAGGKTVAAGVAGEQGSVVATAERNTPSRDAMATDRIIADMIRELAASHDVDGRPRGRRRPRP